MTILDFLSLSSPQGFPGPVHRGSCIQGPLYKENTPEQVVPGLQATQTSSCPQPAQCPHTAGCTVCPEAAQLGNPLCYLCFFLFAFFFKKRERKKIHKANHSPIRPAQITPCWTGSTLPGLNQNFLVQRISNLSKMAWNPSCSHCLCWVTGTEAPS